ncbi:putative lipoprotein [hydrocarbon metagenome]|uniref:Putative lipoprotein n=1 Tax=hydrocarbon metagenome TaxID=938273 RepID=A0A0W8FP32_9ZZZZ
MKQARIKMFLVVCVFAVIGIFSISSYAATANEIDARVNASLDRFVNEVKGAQEFLDAAKGVLIMPKVIEGGLVVGAEYGEGALRIGGKTVGYYNIVSGSFGYQIGAQEKDIILVFMSDKVLKKFRNSNKWKAGVDAKVTLVTVGAAESLSTMKFKQPVVGFVFSQKGLMAGATIEGSKFTRLKK